MAKKKNDSSGALVIFGVLFTGLILLITASTPYADLSSLANQRGVHEIKLNTAITTLLVFTATALFLLAIKEIYRLSLKWLSLAMGYNALFLMVRFGFSPNSYSSNTTSGDLIFTASIVLGLYLLGLYLVYQFFAGTFNKKLDKYFNKSNPELRKLAFTAILFILINVIRMVIGLLPILSKTSAADYLKSVYTGNGMILSAFIFGAIYLLIESFAALGASGKSAHQKLLLKNMFYISAFMITTFHIFWVVYVDALF